MMRRAHSVSPPASRVVSSSTADVRLYVRHQLEQVGEEAVQGLAAAAVERRVALLRSCQRGDDGGQLVAPAGVDDAVGVEAGGAGLAHHVVRAVQQHVEQGLGALARAARRRCARVRR